MQNLHFHTIASLLFINILDIIIHESLRDCFTYLESETLNKELVKESEISLPVY